VFTTNRTMNIQARITLTVECIRTCIFCIVIYVLNTRTSRIATNLCFDVIAKHLHNVDLSIKTVFSCEIEEYKQAYIERNFAPPLLFRDAEQLQFATADTAYVTFVLSCGACWLYSLRSRPIVPGTFRLGDVVFFFKFLLEYNDGCN
jgi:hypothetical protein